MKALWSTLVVILFSFTMVMEEAHAKRMGGGKSFGRSYQSAPATWLRHQAKRFQRD